MKTVGQILKNARLEKQISLEEVSEALKIRKKFLQALEEDNFSALPSYTSSLGFIKNYAEFLGLSPSFILAVFRRDFSKPKIGKEGKIGFIRVGEKQKKVLVLITLFSIFSLGGYLGYQYFSFMKPPSLEVFSPGDNENVYQEKVEVMGKSQPDVLLTINDIPVFVTSEGEFFYQLEVFPGENKIVIMAKNKLGKESKIERVVFRLDK